MSDPSGFEAPVIKSYPRVLYYPIRRLMSWHPVGILDGFMLNELLDFVEEEERSSPFPFSRFADLDSATELHLNLGHAFKASDRRRASYDGQPVKTALLCSKSVGFGLANLYASLMEGSHIYARAFKERHRAAAWLGVPESVLRPGAGVFASQLDPDRS
jgi:hypothetical protein